MKKIILVAFIFIISLSRVHALEYFWSDEKIDGREILAEEKRFRFYREEKEGDYFKKGEVNDKYDYEDNDDIIYRNIGDYKDSCSAGNDNVIVEKKIVYPYKIIPKAKYLKLGNIPSNLNIKKIDIYYNEEKVSYDIKNCTTCSGTTIKAGGSMSIVFDEPLTVGNIRLVVEQEKTNSFAYFAYFNDENYIQIINKILSSMKNEYLIDDYSYQYNNFKETYYSDEKVERDYVKYPLEEKEMCIEKEILTYRYNLNKKYYDNNYHTSVDDSSYVKDEADYKVYYKYLKLEDEIIPEEDSNDLELNSGNNIPSEILDEKAFEEVVETGYKGHGKRKLAYLLSLIPLLISGIIVIFIVKMQKMSN